MLQTSRWLGSVSCSRIRACTFHQFGRRQTRTWSPQRTWDPAMYEYILITSWECFWQKAALLANAGGAGGPVCLFMSQLEKLSCHQLIRQTSDIMEKATKIAEIEGMLDCRGSALCSALWDIFKLCTPAHPPPRHLFLPSHQTPSLLPSRSPPYCFSVAKAKLPSWMKKSASLNLGWMLRDLLAWNMKTKWSFKITPGAFSFSPSSCFSSSFLSSPSTPALY